MDSDKLKNWTQAKRQFKLKKRPRVAGQTKLSVFYTFNLLQRNNL